MPYRIRRSDRARRIRVSVDGNGDIEVVLPRRSPERHAAEAVRELAPWIERRRRAVARAALEVARAPGTVPYLGEALRLVPEPGRTRVHRRGDALLVPRRRPARRRSSAGTGAARRRRSARGWTRRPRAPARATPG